MSQLDHPAPVLEKIVPADDNYGHDPVHDIDELNKTALPPSPSASGDLEAAQDENNKQWLEKDPFVHDEVKEVVPDQAFKWNVDGDQSPFPEVAANVPNTDDPTIQVNSENIHDSRCPLLTFTDVRMWFLLTVFVILFAGVNQFFNLRYVSSTPLLGMPLELTTQPSLTMGYVVAQLLVFPIGKGWARFLPDWRIGFGRFSFRLNPGPFTIKEHAVIVICVSLTSTPAYAMPALVAIQSDVYWGRDWVSG